MNEKLTKLFELCLKARKEGVDCFFDYSPHVDVIRVRVYSNGWFPNITPKSFGLYTGKEDAKEIIDECTGYIEDAIKNKED